MDIKKLEDIGKLHDQLMRKLQRAHPDATRVALPFPELLPQDRKVMVSSLEERIKAVRVSKEQAIKRFDEEIERHQNSIAALKAMPSKAETQAKREEAMQKRASEPAKAAEKAPETPRPRLRFGRKKDDGDKEDEG